MNTWLYKRSRLYRSLFQEEISIRKYVRYRNKFRRLKEYYMRCALDRFEHELRNENYKKAAE